MPDVPSLSVVMPAYNEAAHIRSTLEALVGALGRCDCDAEVVLIDDGSTDDTVVTAEEALDGVLPLRVVRQPNRGRLEARTSGLEAATAELILLLDGRVRLEPDSLRFVLARVAAGERIWTGHVNVEGDSAFGVFWRLLAELAWRDYFDHPRTTSFGAEDFDRYPKGTTCFLAPRDLLLGAMTRFRSRYEDLRDANDDTPILRDLASREAIHVSPEFACSYVPRGSARAFFRHAVHRGVVFLDGHGVPESRFFPTVVAFFPLSGALALLSLRRPWALPAAAAATGAAAAGYGLAAKRSAEEVRVLALVTPVYALGHAIGMWTGLLRLLRARLPR
jgi:glycosyltransferase involved in cell wall biosynthesis